MTKNKNIIILGCPRSGTSLVANLVRSAGYDVDDNGSQRLMKPNKLYNPDGYFERIDIVQLNDCLIKEIGEKYNFLNCPSLTEIISYTYSANQNLNNIREKLISNNGWSLKDSRLAFTLHLYRLQNINIIKVLRDRNAVKKSMQNHYGPLFEQEVVQGPHTVYPIVFDEYYSTINDCIDWQAKNFNQVTLYYDDIVNGKIDKLDDFIEGHVDRSLVNAKYRHYTE